MIISIVWPFLCQHKFCVVAFPSKIDVIVLCFWTFLLLATMVKLSQKSSNSVFLREGENCFLGRILLNLSVWFIIHLPRFQALCLKFGDKNNQIYFTFEKVFPQKFETRALTEDIKNSILSRKFCVLAQDLFSLEAIFCIILWEPFDTYFSCILALLADCETIEAARILVQIILFSGKLFGHRIRKIPQSRRASYSSNSLSKIRQV